MSSTTITDPNVVKQSYKPYTGSQSHVFPPELAKSANFLSMNIRSYQNTPGITSGGSAPSVSGYNIHLPIPYAGLEDNFHIDYENTARDVLGGSASAAMAAYHNRTVAGDPHAGFISKLENGIHGAWDGVSAFVGSELKGTILNKTGTIGQQYVGQAVNPNISVLFKGIGIRTHSFRWKLVAKNSAESNQIYGIIKLLKTAALPSRNASNSFTILDYPDVAFLSLNGPQGNGLITFAGFGCFIEDIQVSYGGSTSPAFFLNSNAPVEVDLMISFRERTIITSSDIAQ